MSSLSPQLQWIKIADDEASLFADGAQTAPCEAKGKKICLIRHHEQLYACAATCPHAGGRMADGYVDALGNIVCPIHRYKFSLKNGRNSSGEGYYLKTWPVEVREDGVYVGMEEKNLFGWFK